MSELLKDESPVDYCPIVADDSELFNQLSAYEDVKDDVVSEVIAFNIFNDQKVIDFGTTVVLSNRDQVKENVVVFMTEPPKENTEPLVCYFEGCGKIFENSIQYNSHVRRHNGKKSFLCKICKKTFTTSFGLKTHLRTHSNERPYECSSCAKKFKTSSDLNRHVRIHTGDKPFMCSLCERTFTTNTACKTHMRLHTNHRPFKCTFNQCNKAFYYLCNLKNHIRTHTGEKPFVCKGCGKGFAEHSSLYKHKNLKFGCGKNPSIVFNS